MMKHGILALALISFFSINSAQAGDCGCDTCQTVSNCSSCCNSCCNPVGNLLRGMHYNLKVGFCNFQSSVKRVLNPICYKPSCGCTSNCATPACGCGMSVDSIQYGSPQMEIIEDTPSIEKSSIPVPPVPPMDKTNIIVPPAKFPPQGKWHQAKSNSSKSRTQLYYSRVMAQQAKERQASTRSAGYYAPTHSVSD